MKTKVTRPFRLMLGDSAWCMNTFSRLEMASQAARKYARIGQKWTIYERVGKELRLVAEGIR